MGSSSWDTHTQYKGNSHMGAGYFFAPYVPLTRTPTVFGQTHQAVDYARGDDVVKPTKAHRSITDPWEVSRFD